MNAIKTITLHFLKNQYRNKTLAIIYAVWLALLVYASYTGYQTYRVQNDLRIAFQQKARQSWEANPDKHPHRMAHFGSFAFRLKHPLSMFELGMESFMGNAVFLEAHKQNTVNFSEAGFSTGLLRFGEISLAMLVQTLLPLILFFLGFNAVAQQKENGTLKMLLGQGTTFWQIAWGNSAGLFVLGLLFLLPVIMATAIQLILTAAPADAEVVSRTIYVTGFVLLYTWIVSVTAIAVSALSTNSRAALLKLLGLWLLMTLIFPKTLQAVGGTIYPAPGKIEFETAVEKDMLALGDSHNPNDPLFKHLKDSVLKAHHVDSVQQLPFNYSGFQKREGERLSAELYNAHLQQLYKRYEQQNGLSYAAAFVDPLLAIKNISMALSSTDFEAYRYFQQQAEVYRYHLAQTMNKLQMEHISNVAPAKGGKPQLIERHYWQDFPDFAYRFPAVDTLLMQQRVGIAAMLVWFVLSIVLIYLTAAKAKAI